MNLFSNISRRTFLRNGTHALTLPFLASLLPAGSRTLAEQSLASVAPKRLLWMTMGHGHMEDHFYPHRYRAIQQNLLASGVGSLEKKSQPLHHDFQFLKSGEQTAS